MAKRFSHRKHVLMDEENSHSGISHSPMTINLVVDSRTVSKDPTLLESRRVRVSENRVRVLPPIGHGDVWSGGVRRG